MSNKFYFSFPGKEGFREIENVSEPLTLYDIPGFKSSERKFDIEPEMTFTYKKKLKNRKQRKKYKMFLRKLMMDFMV